MKYYFLIVIRVIFPKSKIRKKSQHRYIVEPSYTSKGKK